MADAFKHVFSLSSITNMANHLEKSFGEVDSLKDLHFNKQAFIEAATKSIDQLEMKQRSDQIVSALVEFMPEDFEECAKVFMGALSKEQDGGGLGNTLARKNSGIEGWLISPMADYVGKYGRGNFETSMRLFKAFTTRFSSEFGIRYFLMNKPEQTLEHLRTWLNDDNHHVRRLISEGTRPRLPWGMRLDGFVNEPEPVIKLISMLKDDESEYVRRSVANNLNDIAKDHPQTISKLAATWLIGASKDRVRLVKHACRTLLKNGHPATLRVFGFESPEIEKVSFALAPKVVAVGETLSIEFTSRAKSNQTWMIDYAIHHRKANGTTRPKVFKGKQVKVEEGKLVHFNKLHSFKPVTTRVYYEGEHAVEIFINGQSVCKAYFELI